MAESVADTIESAREMTVEMEECSYVITPPQVKQSAPIRFVKITHKDANGKPVSVSHVHLLGALLDDRRVR